MERLIKTLNEMNNTFSSNEFSEKAKKNGVSQYEINNGIIASFLHDNSIQLTRRLWEKKDTNHLAIIKAIELLKQNGYKVFKSVTDYVEV